MRAFSLLELIAVIVVLGLLLATFIPYAFSLRENARRTRCTEQLRQISTALSTYASTNDWNYPRTRASAEPSNAWTSFTGANDANPFADDSKVEPNDVTAPLWLLVRLRLIEPSAFICPSSYGTADDASQRELRGNFRSPKNLTYSYATPYSSIPEYKLNDTLPARFALMSDQAPNLANQRIPRADTGFGLARGNSPNHGGAGQTVLFADGSVRFEASPYCGVARADAPQGDNIFTALERKPLVVEVAPDDPGVVVNQEIGPSYRYDSVLVPAARD
ncbi:MAG TPA: type II secretion system protein [Tepidisphaeraceae bacterium]|nr:type II secretion system protein [Tepidisphaeraceae bacterium]